MLDATFILDVMDLWPEAFERVLPGPAFLRRLIAPLFLGYMAARRDKLVAMRVNARRQSSGLLCTHPLRLRP